MSACMHDDCYPRLCGKKKSELLTMSLSFCPPFSRLRSISTFWLFPMVCHFLIACVWALRDLPLEN